MSDYVADSIAHFRQHGIDPDAHFVINTPIGQYSFDAPSAAEALRIFIEQHPEIHPLDCVVRSLRELFVQAGRHINLPESEQGAAIFRDSLAEAAAFWHEAKQLKKGRIQ